MLNPAAAGRLIYYNVPSGSPRDSGELSDPPTSMVQNDETNDIYVTEIFTGRVMKVTN